MAERQTILLKHSIKKLADKGLNLFAILRYSDLPHKAVQGLSQFDFPLNDETRIILMGHGGKYLWQKLAIASQTSPDPIDHYSRSAALAFAKATLGQSAFQLIYPDEKTIALQQLGTAAGWHTPSPLGLGINPRWGLWYAYRAVLLTNVELPVIVESAPTQPCADCHDKTCISHCPAMALKMGSQINIESCATYRLAENSSCRDRCLARISCPVSTEHRYTLEQIQYHYRLSLETLRHYYR